MLQSDLDQQDFQPFPLLSQQSFKSNTTMSFEPNSLLPGSSSGSSSLAARAVNEEIKRLQALQQQLSRSNPTSAMNPMGSSSGGGGASSFMGGGGSHDGNSNMNNNMSVNMNKNTQFSPSLSSRLFNAQQVQQQQQQQPMMNSNDFTSHLVELASPANQRVNNPMLAQLLAAQQQGDDQRSMLQLPQANPNNNSSNPFAGMSLPNLMASRTQNNSSLMASLPQAPTVEVTPSLLQLQQQSRGGGAAPSMDSNQMMKVGAIEPFPEKLHRLLLEVEIANRTDVISFVNQGRAFVIHKPDTFFKEIIPLYFRHSRLSSFKRQLNLYGFEQITYGPFRGGYMHALFLRGNPELCRSMRRVPVKMTGASSKTKKEPTVPQDLHHPPLDQQRHG